VDLGPISKVSVAISITIAVLISGSACRRETPRYPVIGEAFVGPAAISIRKDIPIQSPSVATAKHGERLEILQRRRAFYRVRTKSGAEGWADERQLLAAGDMENIKRLAEVAAKLPSQGAASPRYGDLRIYMAPSRDSASFVTVKETGKVDVLSHMMVPRVKTPRAPLLPPAPKKAPLPKRTKSGRLPPIPMPKPPPLPPDYEELSKTDTGEPQEEAPEEPPPPNDNWSLVRTAGGETGWTLTRWLNMAIPDDVGQYAEGRRIVSYFSLGAVNDGGNKKDTWLWTTVGSGEHPYDFDNIRVFLWNVHRHRYETIYIERNMTGFEPVKLGTVTYSGAQYPGFSVCSQKKDGGRYWRDFALVNNLVRLAGERPCEPEPTIQDLVAAAEKPANEAAPASHAKPSFASRVKNKVKSWLGKL